MQLNAINRAINRMQAFRLGVGGTPAWSPIDLFANGEPGFWYDPSDLATMFQDSSGTIPMAPVGTVADQPVGLILDKSQGLVLGPEQVVNGDFSAGLTGWTAVAGVSSSGGAAVFSGVTDIAGIYGNAGALLDKTYEVSFTILTVTAGGAGVYLLGGTGQPRETAPGTYTRRLRLSVANANVGIEAFGFTGTIDNISVREIPGNHAFQATSTARPLLSARVNLLTKTEDFTDAAWEKNSTTILSTTATAPDGTSTATTFSINSIYGNIKTISTMMMGGVYYASVFYARTDDASPRRLDLVDDFGTILGSYTPTSNWVKYSIPLAQTGGADSKFTIAQDRIGGGAVTVQLWHPGLNLGSTALDYQRVNTDSDYDGDPAKFPPFLKFNGTDSRLLTSAFSMAPGKVTVFAGTANAKTTGTGTLLEFSANYLNNVGGFAMLTPSLATSHISFGSNGGAAGEKETQEGPAGLLRPRVLTGANDFATTNDYGCEYIRFNQIPVGNLVGAGNSDVGAGPYGTFPAYIGARNDGNGGTNGNLINGYIYSLTCAGNIYSTPTLVQMEEWIDAKLNPGAP